MEGNSNTKKKADLKVIILGAANVGKTTFIHRYISGNFEETISTIGASFFLKQFGRHNIAIWDTAGEERFTGLSSFYCRNAGAAILAYDLTNEDSFHTLRARFLPLLQAADPECYVVVVGMKHDLVAKETRPSFTKKDPLVLAGQLNSSRTLDKVPYYETSSISGQNVDQVFQDIFEICLPLKGPKVTGTVDVGKKSNSEGKSGGGCGC